MVTYDSALSKQRFKDQGATPIACAITPDWRPVRAAFERDVGFGRQAVPTIKGRYGNTVWRIPQYVLERADDPAWRFIEVWAPAHIMRQTLGCDIFVLGVTNG